MWHAMEIFKFLFFFPFLHPPKCTQHFSFICYSITTMIYIHTYIYIYIYIDKVSNCFKLHVVCMTRESWVFHTWSGRQQTSSLWLGAIFGPRTTLLWTFVDIVCSFQLPKLHQSLYSHLIFCRLRIFRCKAVMPNGTSLQNDTDTSCSCCCLTDSSVKLLIPLLSPATS
jgi:hypothetical protein